jgi:hypothetical protein
MAPDGSGLTLIVDVILSALRRSSQPLLSTSVVEDVLCVVWVPGMRPQAPKRNVIIGLVYLYALILFGGLLFEFAF